MKSRQLFVLLGVCLFAFLAPGLRAAATLQIGEGTAAPGEMDGSIPISFLLDPEEGSVSGTEPDL